MLWKCQIGFILLFLDSATYRKAVDGGKLTDIYKHFKKQLKQFLHHSGNVTCVSEDPEQFKQVVAAFDVYEQQVSLMENNFVEIPLRVIFADVITYSQCS